jgi:hypothetical protein
VQAPTIEAKAKVMKSVAYRSRAVEPPSAFRRFGAAFLAALAVGVTALGYVAAMSLFHL